VRGAGHKQRPSGGFPAGLKYPSGYAIIANHKSAFFITRFGVFMASSNSAAASLRPTNFLPARCVQQLLFSSLIYMALCPIWQVTLGAKSHFSLL
jgi:hypothetical protein